jgi:predicted CXXCH cytochrome family protein
LKIASLPLRMKSHHTILFFFFLALVLISACSPKGEYRVLNFFFDGVPDSLHKENNVRIDSTVKTDSAGLLAGKTLNKGPHYLYHTPYYKQECSSCHDNNKKSSLVQTQPALCFKCHKDFNEKFAFVHGPVAGGYCTVCHAPHMSEYPKLLKQKGKELCLQCHPNSLVMKNSAHKVAVEMECISCHDPHGGANKALLK